MESISSERYKRLQAAGYIDPSGRPTKRAWDAVEESIRLETENHRLRSSENFNALADRQRRGSS